ncbi:MAG TPA: MBL fold metallo-hydrolase [Gaiellaceae bacterium]|nr:MBL fold metallo-hydrolase [Gaiellaceae bacterium]
MRVTIWGCRGSLPTPGRSTVRYGGNTSCLEVELASGSVLVLDAGTGIRELGAELERRSLRRVQLLLTHLHLDHLEGLRFFAPLWDERVEIDIWGPPSPVQGLPERVARAFSPPLFPVELADVPAKVSFNDVPREQWRLDDATVRAELIVHPGPTVGYRIETADGAFAYLPDHEPALAGSLRGRSRDWISGASIAAGADVLVHDAQFSEEEYSQRVGWGHSSSADAIAYAEAVGAGEVVLFHHDPNHDDAWLDESERRLAGSNGSAPTFAREGMVLEIGGA